ncbi:Rieske 2Fe-2S domain-containing protein [Roseobacter sp.]|uniref:Rieske 2Fe-2S domain-containing protein n=1 Tax=Roseobacter sp. TaxID=1907202 RepID=UPI0032980F1B
MSVKYTPVQWNWNKYIYDAVMLAGAGAFLYIFLYITPDVLSHERPINGQIHNARAFGACAFVMLTVILCIGPLARLDARFLPLLYNRRHFGVMTVFVAITHAGYVVDWYFAFSQFNKYEAVLFSNTSFGQLAGFPFEVFGLFALATLIVLAATSHDFWMKFLSPPVWKRIHFLIYPAYLSVVAHVALGVLQDQQNHAVTGIFVGGAVTVGGLHLLAALHERKTARAPKDKVGGWVRVCDLSEMRDGFAKVKLLSCGERVAVYLNGGHLSAISNACAHQNGPLGEGKIIDCLVTCPWHGFQYDVTTGRSPAPFTEMVPTYHLRLDGTTVLVHARSNPPGTYVEPVPVPEGAA